MSVYHEWSLEVVAFPDEKYIDKDMYDKIIDDINGLSSGMKFMEYGQGAHENDWDDRSEVMEVISEAHPDLLFMVYDHDSYGTHNLYYYHDGKTIYVEGNVEYPWWKDYDWEDIT